MCPHVQLMYKNQNSLNRSMTNTTNCSSFLRKGSYCVAQAGFKLKHVSCLSVLGSKVGRYAHACVCACMCRCVYMCVFTHVCTGGGQRSYQCVFFSHYFVFHGPSLNPTAALAGQSVQECSPPTWGVQTCATSTACMCVCGFLMWVLGPQTTVLRLARQTLELHQSPSPALTALKQILYLILE